MVWFGFLQDRIMSNEELLPGMIMHAIPFSSVSTIKMALILQTEVDNSRTIFRIFEQVCQHSHIPRLVPFVAPLIPFIGCAILEEYELSIMGL